MTKKLSISLTELSGASLKTENLINKKRTVGPNNANPTVIALLKGFSSGRKK